MAKYTTLLALAGVVSLGPNLARGDSAASTEQKPAPSTSSKGQAAPEQPGQGGMTERSLGGSSSEQGSGGPGNRRMLRQRDRDRMHAHGQEMMAKLQEMQSRLDEKLATMNATTGRDRIDAMAAVINELVHQHDQIFRHIIEMHGQHMEQMQGGGDQQDSGQGQDKE